MGHRHSWPGSRNGCAAECQFHHELVNGSCKAAASMTQVIRPTAVDIELCEVLCGVEDSVGFGLQGPDPARDVKLRQENVQTLLQVAECFV